MINKSLCYLLLDTSDVCAAHSADPKGWVANGGEGCEKRLDCMCNACTELPSTNLWMQGVEQGGQEGFKKSKRGRREGSVEAYRLSVQCLVCGVGTEAVSGSQGGVGGNQRPPPSLSQPG